MKKYIFILSVFVSINLICEAQSDSSNQRVSGVIIKGREADVVAYIVKVYSNDFPILDSVLKILYVIKPGNNTDVTFNGIPNKEWIRMLKKVALIPSAIIKNAYSNIRTELNIHGGAWVIHRIVLYELSVDDDFDSIKKVGQNYAQKKDDGDSF